MRGRPTFWVRLRARTLLGVALSSSISGLQGNGRGEEPAPLPFEKQESKAVAKAQGTQKADSMPLLACRQLGLERAPTMAAARTSLAAAEARQQAVCHLQFASLIARDLPIRRQQAAFGVSISAAAITQAEWDTVHSITFSYLSAIYARKQLKVADEAVSTLKQLRDIVDKAVQTGKRADLSTRDLKTIDVYLLVGEARREEAVSGEDRALSALREAMGVGEDCPLTIGDSDFKTADPPPIEVIVSEALGRRGELVQATSAAQVTCLEIDAQRKRHGLKADTFAAASDIHAREVPQAQHNETYRPGALGLEMPVLIPGCKNDRVNQAHLLHERTEAVVEKTHKLVAFEAEQAFYRWQEASRKRDKMEKAAVLADTIFKTYNPLEHKETLDLVLRARLDAINTRLQANEVEYKRLATIAELERVTAGGYDPAWRQTPAANGVNHSAENK